MSHVLLPGQRLREAREAKGLSVQDVAKALHMSTAYVKALEADDYERLPEAAFVKGYLRNYARLTGLPSDDVANMFSQVMAEEPAKNTTQERSEISNAQGVSQSWLLYAGAGAVALLLVLWWGLAPDAADDSVRSIESQNEQVLSAVESGSADQALIDSSAEGEVSGQESPAIEADVADASVNDAAEDNTVTSSAATQVGDSQPVAETVVASTDVLKVAFSDDCWVKVSDATGATVFTGQKSVANTLVVQGQSPFRVTLGNAAAVSSISVNDNSVSVPAARPGRVLTLRAE